MRRSPTDGAARSLGLGGTVIAVCCGTHLLLAGVLGGVAFGTVAGVGAGLAVLVALLAAVVVRRRRSACRRVPSTEGDSASEGTGAGVEQRDSVHA